MAEGEVTLEAFTLHDTYLHELPSPPLVIDTGAQLVKAGVAGDEEPSVVIPTAVGRVPLVPIEGLSKVYCGQAALDRRATHRIRWPVERKTIINFSDVEEVWHHVFYNELKVAPEEHAVVLSYPSDCYEGNKSKMMQIMFETFSVPGLHLGDMAVMALHADEERKTGVVIDIGASSTLITPVYEGHALKNATFDAVVSGSNLSDYLMRILSERGYTLTTTAERMLVNDMKEKFGFCSLDFDADMRKYRNAKLETYNGPGVINTGNISGTYLTSLPNELLNRINEISFHNMFTRGYVLPDGQVVELRDECFRCVEPLFCPALLGFSAASLSDCAFNAIYRCPVEIRKTMFENVVLTGGSSLFPGLVERLQRDLVNMAPTTVQVKVRPPVHKYGTWVGGSKMASQPEFVRCMHSREAYDEFGPSLLARTSF